MQCKYILEKTLMLYNLRKLDEHDFELLFIEDGRVFILKFLQLNILGITYPISGILKVIK